jgi:hypothetical protein
VVTSIQIDRNRVVDKYTLTGICQSASSLVKSIADKTSYNSRIFDMASSSSSYSTDCLWARWRKDATSFSASWCSSVASVIGWKETTRCSSLFSCSPSSCVSSSSSLTDYLFVLVIKCSDTSNTRTEVIELTIRLLLLLLLFSLYVHFQI